VEEIAVGSAAESTGQGKRGAGDEGDKPGTDLDGVVVGGMQSEDPGRRGLAGQELLVCSRALDAGVRARCTPLPNRVQVSLTPRMKPHSVKSLSSLCTLPGRWPRSRRHLDLSVRAPLGPVVLRVRGRRHDQRSSPCHTARSTSRDPVALVVSSSAPDETVDHVVIQRSRPSCLVPLAIPVYGLFHRSTNTSTQEAGEA